MVGQQSKTWPKHWQSSLATCNLFPRLARGSIMARRLKTEAQIDRFIARVLAEATHHAPGVADVIEPLSDAVRRHLNLTTDTIEVYERNGEIARTCWVTIDDCRYAFSYNYDDGMIDVRERSLQGDILFQFDNNTTGTQIGRQVRRLWPKRVT